MIRNGAIPAETAGGTFYIGLTRMDDKDEELAVYAETESGDVTINGVTYRGTAYYKPHGYRLSSGEYFKRGHWWDTRHVDRWDDAKSKFIHLSDAASRKLGDWLTPVAEALLADTDATRAYELSRATYAYTHKVKEIREAIDEANILGAKVRDLGGSAEVITGLAGLVDLS